MKLDEYEAIILDSLPEHWIAFPGQATFRDDLSIAMSWESKGIEPNPESVLVPKCPNPEVEEREMRFLYNGNKVARFSYWAIDGGRCAFPKMRKHECYVEASTTTQMHRFFNMFNDLTHCGEFSIYWKLYEEAVIRGEGFFDEKCVC